MEKVVIKNKEYIIIIPLIILSLVNIVVSNINEEYILCFGEDECCKANLEFMKQISLVYYLKKTE